MELRGTVPFNNQAKMLNQPRGSSNGAGVGANVNSAANGTASNKTKSVNPIENNLDNFSRLNSISELSDLQNFQSSNYPRSDSINSFLNNFQRNPSDSSYPSYYLNHNDSFSNGHPTGSSTSAPSTNTKTTGASISSSANDVNYLPPPSSNQIYPDSLPFNQIRRPSEQLEPFIPSTTNFFPSTSSSATANNRTRSNSNQKRQYSILPSTSIGESHSDFDSFLKRDSVVSSKGLIDLSQINFDNLPSSTELRESRSSLGSISGLLASLTGEKKDSIDKKAENMEFNDNNASRNNNVSMPIPNDKKPTTLREDIFTKKNDDNERDSKTRSLPKARRNAIAPKDESDDIHVPREQLKSTDTIDEPQSPKTSPSNLSQYPNQSGNLIPNQQQYIANSVPNQYQTNHLIPTQEMVTSEDGRPLLGATKIDQLMLVIQARDKGVKEQIQQAPDGSILDDGSIAPQPIELVGGIEKPKSKGSKQHQCPYCLKKFTQSTHLEVHVRSHIGYKPFECNFCHKRFTQGGNLRTHLRLHTGEKPFTCEVCNRSFSRKGNLAAHKLTHDNLKPFECKLDGCNKSFTQLGNLKAHQNRFHLNTLNELTRRLAELGPDNDFEKIPTDEKHLLNYFKNLYKNSNRGIRGRGKRMNPVGESTSPPGGEFNGNEVYNGQYVSNGMMMQNGQMPMNQNY